MGNRGGLVVYVTSHGFGHLNRTVAVINRMPRDLPVTIRSHPNLFDHWRERLRRPATLEAHVSDVGALNPPGDSSTTDSVGTLALLAAETLVDSADVIGGLSCDALKGTDVAVCPHRAGDAALIQFVDGRRSSGRVAGAIVARINGGRAGE